MQGDWPATAPLARLWPAPFELGIDAPELMTAAGRPARLDLALAGDADRLVLERFRLRAGDRRWDIAGTAARGERGVRVDGRLTATDAATAALPTALGLGWLGDGQLALEGALTARGTSPGELVADLDGGLAVDGTVGPSVRRGVDGRPLRLPSLALTGTLQLDRGRFDAGDLRADGARLDGAVDLFADRLAARLTLPGPEGVRVIRAVGPLDRPRWRPLDPRHR